MTDILEKIYQETKKQIPDMIVRKGESKDSEHVLYRDIIIRVNPLIVFSQADDWVSTEVYKIDTQTMINNEKYILMNKYPKRVLSDIVKYLEITATINFPMILIDSYHPDFDEDKELKEQLPIINEMYRYHLVTDACLRLRDKTISYLKSFLLLYEFSEDDLSMKEFINSFKEDNWKRLYLIKCFQ